jgi:putative flippase GtrA
MTALRMELLRLVRFGMVGSVNTLVSYLVFAGLLRVGWHYAAATLVGSICGMVLGFRLHGRFVFRNPGRGRFLRFALFFVGLYGLSIGIQALARMAMNGYLAGALAASITIPTSFLLNRNFVYHRDPNQVPGS